MSPLVYGYSVDKENSSKKINSVISSSDEGDICYKWFHLNSGHVKARNWLEEKSQLPEIIIENLMSNETRPNVFEYGTGTLITLRGVNSIPDGLPEDFNAINLWIESNRIISIRNHRILAIEDIMNNIEKNMAPKNVGEFLYLLIKKMNMRIGTVIDAIEDESDNIEEKVLEKKYNGIRVEVSQLRKRIIQLRRYLVPQRDVLHKIYSGDYDWMDDKTRAKMRNTYERLIRYIEDIDIIKDHLMMSQEEITNVLNEEMNNTMYRLSIISALFLPLGFITGLLGVNIGGMPGVSNGNAFNLVAIGCAMFLIGGFIYYKFRKQI